MATSPGFPPRRRQPEIERAEAELLKRLQADGFDETGAAWAALRRRLVEYGYSLLVEILQVPGAAYRMARSHNGGVSVRGLPKLPRGLALSEDAARTVAVDVLAAALVPFHKALREGRWDPAGSASLTTFFFGRCLMELPDRYQHWARRQAPGPVDVLSDDDGGESRDVWPGFCGSDPAEQAVASVLIAEVDPDVRAMFGLKLAGYTRAEIAEMFNRAGRLTKGGGPWTEAVVRTALYRATKEVKQ